MSLVLGFVPLVAWLYLLFGRGFFWLTRERDDKDAPAPKAWPSVAAVVPARDEADVIARSIGSLMAQDYAGTFHVILVDDQSGDGTGDAARALGCEVLSGAPRPPGWTGKLWAVKQGIAHAGTPDYLWLTDADIAHTPDNLSKLVARAEAGGLVLTSLMAKLHCASLAEKLLIPAFVFFFDMLFPFGWVNDRRNATAAAAGGCMLVKREALERAGGIDVIRREIIDDCALGRAMKAQGPIWLGLTDRATSLRPYEGMGEIRRMVARSAYAQLSYSPLLLAGTVIGMALVYAAAPFAAVFAHGPAQVAGIAAWALMALGFAPMLRFYRLSPFWGLALPLIGALYGAFTLDSAVQHWRGRGGMWKGRAQAMDGT
ncbi:MAG TPA: glycosyltransferase [Rhizomicrobium sp.]|jgi:hopene-associated glycosyltransferase HpnB|nr:glycosyltransferase [Rhizomicrobium sp.]